MHFTLPKLYVKDRIFYKEAAGIIIPVTLQSIISTGVNMMDTIMVGTIGQTQLSAVSLANQFINVFQILCMGLGMGASVIVARYYGMQEKLLLKKAVAIMIRLCLLLSLGFCAATFFWPAQIMRIYTVEAPIINCGRNYLEWSVLSYFFLSLSWTCTILLRNVGQARLPLYTSIAAFFINVGANYIFIFGKFGAPRMEEAGAALGTLIARVFEFAVICGFMLFRDDKIAFRTKDLFINTRILWKEYFRICIPVLISDGLYALGNNSVAMVIGRLGENFVAANAVTQVTQQLSTVSNMGLHQAAAIMTGVTLGTGKKEKAWQQGYAFLGLGILFGAAASVLILIISMPIINSYNLEVLAHEIAGQLMFSISVIVFFQTINSVLAKGVLRGGGDTKVLMVADNIFLWLVSVPLGILAGFVWHLPAFWIYFSLKIDQVLKAFWCLIRLRSGKWIKKIKSSEELGQ